jgi:hypothetical protein
VASELIKIAKDRRFWRGPAVWVILILVGANVWAAEHAASMDAIRRATLLQINQTSGVDPAAIYDESVGENIRGYWPLIPDTTKQRVVVLSGMSQMFTINDRKPGDKTISEWMDQTLRPQGVRVWGEAAPNECNEEAMLQMVAFCSEARTTPAVFIYGLCFDKFRNVDLRPGYLDFLSSRPDLQTLWQQTAMRFAKTYPEASAKMLSTLQSLRQTDVGQSDSFESRLRDFVGRYSPLVATRKDLNAWAQIEIFALRNVALHITPTSKRPIIQSRYDFNRQFLGMMADVAKAHHVQLIVYIIPLNPLAQNPYVPAEYEAFKEWAKQFAADRGLPFANLENLIPHDEWGEFMGGPDFKHFRGEGHKRTAAALIDTFGPWLLK